MLLKYLFKIGKLVSLLIELIKLIEEKQKEIEDLRNMLKSAGLSVQSSSETTAQETDSLIKKAKELI